MIDIDYLKKINLVSRPLGQRFVGNFLLLPNYHLFAKVDIEIVNRERIPRGENVIFAMNHTDRFNYWPFQYKMLKLQGISLYDRLGEGQILQERLAGQRAGPVQPHSRAVDGLLSSKSFTRRSSSGKWTGASTASSRTSSMAGSPRRGRRNGPLARCSRRWANILPNSSGAITKRPWRRWRNSAGRPSARRT